MVFTEPIDGVNRLLSEQPQLDGLCVADADNMIYLYLFLWADNWQSCTAVKFWLVDPLGLIFGDNRSRMELICEYTGGENILSRYLPAVLHGLVKLGNRYFKCRYTNVCVTPLLAVFDHSALHAVTCTPPGNSIVCDPLGNNQRSNWSLASEENTTQFKVSDHTSGYNTCVTWAGTMKQVVRTNNIFKKMRVPRHPWQKPAERPFLGTWHRPSEIQMMQAARRMTDLTVGRFSGPPLLARALGEHDELPLFLLRPGPA